MFNTHLYIDFYYFVLDITVEIKQSFQQCTKTLRILAKFLGYIESIPYKTDTKLPDKVFESGLKVRFHLQPSFDLKQILNDAVLNGKLILTIPWITTYLAMMDYVSLCLPCYKNILTVLFEIYFAYNWQISFRHKDNAACINLSLGWLFEQPQFPTELYFNWLSASDKICILKQNNDKIVVDDLKIVDQSILYSCCPFLTEIKILLQSNTSNNNTTVKHITPLTTNDSPTEATEKKLKVTKTNRVRFFVSMLFCFQMQLEEAFLNSQPLSTRKTVDFVSERVASSCIKHICNKIVPDYKKVTLNEFKSIIKQNNRVS